MPIHDWARVDDAAYHSFQLGWACQLCDHLNRGLLPQPLYAMTETLELRPPAEFSPLPEPSGPVSRRTWDEDLPDITEHPPHILPRAFDNRRQYACGIVSIRDDLHQPIAAVYWAGLPHYEPVPE